MPHAPLPPLYRDRAFWAMTVTQFLGALNDNVFKQIVLLLSVNVVLASGEKTRDLQPVANAVFALSFVLFSGTAGYWSDRLSKRSIIVACKLGEIAVMLAGVAAMAVMTSPGWADGLGSLVPNAGGDAARSWITQGAPLGLLAVLFFMGLQSALFGPAKYGILPEMVRPADLPRFNGMVQMTTFLAIILGTAAGGSLLHRLGAELWMAGMVCVGIAVVGTLTALGVRRTPVAQKDARFDWSAVAVAGDTWRALRRETTLPAALLVYALFWFMGSVVMMTVNAFGQNQLRLNYERTSLMLAVVAAGIAAGCLAAGGLSRGRINFGLVRWGAWGAIVTLAVLALPSLGGPTAAEPDGVNHLLGYRASLAVLAASGFCAGVIAVPLQVYLQACAPAELKGRVIGTMNLVNWIAIILSAGYYALCAHLLRLFHLPPSVTFAAAAAVLLPAAIWFRPSDVELEAAAGQAPPG